MEFRIGEVFGAAVTDGQFPADVLGLFPDADAALLEEWFRHHPEADPHEPSAAVCLLLRDRDVNVVVDTGFGALASRYGFKAGRLVDALEAKGVKRTEVDVVALTHAHPDHIGGLTRGPGEDELTFPNARHVLRRPEWTYWMSEAAAEGMREVVRPRLAAVEGAGSLQLVDDAVTLTRGVELVPASGHTPGHAVVAVTGHGRGVLHLGDAVVHELQLAHPDWNAVVDVLPIASVHTRRRLLERAARHGERIIAFHLGRTGQVVQRGDSFALDPSGSDRLQ